MDNTLESKAKFFAQYFGQEVRDWNRIPNLCKVGYVAFDKENLTDSHLKLKSLSDISDDDAVEVAKIWRNPTENKIIGCFLISRISDGSYTTPTEMRNTIAVIDYLRSKGYLLPFNGLSTQELIDRKWARI